MKAWSYFNFALLCTTMCSNNQVIEAKALSQAMDPARQNQSAQGNQRDECFGSCDDAKTAKAKLKELFRLIAKKEKWDVDQEKFEKDLDSRKVAQSEDVRFTKDQVDFLIKSFRRRQKRKMHNFATDKSFKKWDKFPIKYRFNGDHNRKQIEAIESAMHHWEANTCVRFQRAGQNELMRDTHIIFKSLKGCSSNIGKINKIEQVVDLVEWCTDRMAVIAHELGHVIGLWHEHQRSDRDNYVAMLSMNMKESMKKYTQLMLRGHTMNNVTYDYGSIMHYKGSEESANGRNTIQTHNPLFQQTLGQATGLSFLDAKSVNMEYCRGVCKNTLGQTCQNNGYQDPNNCYQCKCPDGFSGTFCKDIEPAKGAKCGAIISASPWGTYITSPGYYSGYYKDNTECTWLIKAPQGQRVVLQFEGDFSIYCYLPGIEDICYHWVEVRYNKDVSASGPRFCCKKRPSVVLRSEGTDMMILMRTNFSTSDTNEKGFKARVYAEPASDQRIQPESPAITTTTTKKTTTPIPTTTRRTTTKPTTTTAKPTTTTKLTTTTTKRTRQRVSTTRTADCGAMDIAFILDSSGSVKVSGWTKVKEFVINVVSRLGLEKNQYGVISYGNRGTVNIPFSDHTSMNSITQAVLRIPFKDQNTNTVAGLRSMNRQLFTSRGGARDQAVRLAIIVTDGKATRETDQLGNMANEARSWKGITLIGIGVGPKASLEELRSITGSWNHVIRRRDFYWLAASQTTDIVMNKIKDVLHCRNQPDTPSRTNSRHTTTTPRPTTTTRKTSTTPRTTTTTTKATTTTTISTTTTTTVKPTTTKVTPLRGNNKRAAGWSDWTKCSVACGGCGYQSRYKMCRDDQGNSHICRPEIKERIRCGLRSCGEKDMCTFFVGRVITRKCDICCAGYSYVDGVCVRP